MPDLRVGEIKQLLVAQCPGLLHELVPGLRREGSRVFAAPNPLRGETKPGSFKVWANGAWREYDESEDVGKGDILGLIAYIAGLPPKSTEGRRHAIQWAKHRLGLDTAKPAELKRRRQALTREAASRKLQQEREESARLQRRFERALQIWGQARPGEAAIARYLAARGIDLGAIEHRVQSLRFHPALDHWAMPHGQAWRGPAMIGRIVNGSGVMTAIHATFLRDDFAGKADAMPNPKLMIGQVQGGFVPLTLGPSGLSVVQAAERGILGPVGLGEGIETSLAVAQAVPELRMWACLNLGNMGHAPVHLPCIDAIVPLLENDTKPQALKQRDKVLEQLAASGKRVRPIVPPSGNDFADIMKGC